MIRLFVVVIPLSYEKTVKGERNGKSETKLSASAWPSRPPEDARPTNNAATNANKSPFPFCTITGFSYIYKVMQNKANPVTPRCHLAFHHTESPRPKGALP